MTRLPLLIALTATVACAKKREPAPAEMEAIAAYMLRVWEDERALEDGMANLAPWLAENARSDTAQEGFLLTPIDAAAVEPLGEIPDRELSLLLGAAVAGISPHDITRHAGHMVLEDQIFSNPRNYESYERSVTGDREAFLGGEGRIDTINAIETSNFGVSIPYTLFKDYRWVYADDIGPAIIARSWIPEPGCNEGGENCLQQSFSVDLWWEEVPGETIRFTATWSEVTSSLDGVIGDDLRIAALANGMAFVFEATDEFLAEND